MLTRDLLRHRVRAGVVRPLFVDAADPALLAVAERLLSEAGRAVGRTQAELEDALAAEAGAEARNAVPRGLSKLVLDGATIEEPDPSAQRRRRASFDAAALVLRALPPAASISDHEAALATALGRPLDEVRAELHADLPPRRRVTDVERLGPGALLDHYNLALAQGLVLSARALSIRVLDPELLPVRRLLRRLKFCRLVAEVERDERGWRLRVEGPGAQVALQKRYGLQLAVFLGAVPALPRWELEAEVELSRRRRALLRLDMRDPLVAPPAALGHVPPELTRLAAAFEADGWEVETTPLPRHVGAAGICVPDLTFRHRATGRELHLELFHAWHAGPLARRLEELRARPDPLLLLGVERSLPADAPALAALEANPQVLLFRDFPTLRRLREALERAVTCG